MRFAVLFFMFLVCSCSAVDGSKMLVENTQSEIADVQDTIKKFEKATKEECKNDVFKASIDSIEKQIKNINGQIEIIGNACDTEKQVLKEQITVRNVVIAFLAFLGFLLAYRVIKK